MTAPVIEYICCRIIVTEKFVVGNKIFEQVIDFFTSLRLRCLQTKSNCCVNLLWEYTKQILLKFGKLIEGPMILHGSQLWTLHKNKWAEVAR